jgi:hypothetical protein
MSSSIAAPRTIVTPFRSSCPGIGQVFGDAPELEGLVRGASNLPDSRPYETWSQKTCDGNVIGDHDVKDLGLADAGQRRIEWAEQEMPVLRLIRERFEGRKPLAGIRLAACLHVTTETANLMRTLKAGGADVRLCASNPLSTQDDAAAALVAHHDVPVFAIKGEDHDTYYRHIHQAIAHKPHLTMDDGADTVGVLHKERTDLLEISSAAPKRRPRASSACGPWRPMGCCATPSSPSTTPPPSTSFDNRYGTGQSTIDGIVRATNILLAGKNGSWWVAMAGAAGASPCGPGHGRQRGRHRGRSAAGPGGGHGWLPRDAHARGGPD